MMNSFEKHIADDRMPEAVRKILSAKKRRRRIIFAALGSLPFVLIGWWLWSNEAGNRAIQAQIDRYRAAGQPVYPADFDPPPTPDENNAALALKEAAAALDLEDTVFDFSADGCDPRKISKHHDEFNRITKTNSEVLALIRQARSMTGADWGMRMRSPVIAVLIPSLGDRKDLIRFLFLTAIYYHQIGNDAEAIEILRDALASAKALRKMRLLISLMVTVAEDALVCSTIEDITVDLKVLPSGSVTSASSQAVGRKQVRALIAELLDEKELCKSAQWSFYAERAFVFDTAMLCLDGKQSLSLASGGVASTWEKVKVNALKPVLKEDAIRMLRYMTVQAEAAGQTNWPAVKEKMPEDPQVQGLLKRLTHMFSNTLAPTLGRAMEMDFRSRAMRRMAAVALAIRLYEIDNGRRPEKLTDLVPKYIPAIPDDPFDTPGRPLRYLPGVQRPILFSIGGNGKDQGGQYAENPDEPPDYDDYDIPFFLNGDRPRYEEESDEKEPASQPRVGSGRFGGRGMARRSKPPPTTMPR
ncbi:MAG: hypothetical protein SVV80_11985 [Planctomycetota bacterium]|nr:hypothetical protein [Planctomycetota bacterium]